MKMGSVRLMLTLVFLTSLGSCAIIKNIGNSAPSGRIVAIPLFKCNCEPLIQEAVQDSLIDVFFTNTNAKPVKGEKGDITIVGIITMAAMQSGSSQGGIYGSSSSGSVAISGSESSNSTTGSYVAAITIQAYKNGELIATSSVGQDRGNGTLDSSVSLAQDAVWKIVKVLARQNEIGYK
jgi:hypothetical protein